MAQGALSASNQSGPSPPPYIRAIVCAWKTRTRHSRGRMYVTAGRALAAAQTTRGRLFAAVRARAAGFDRRRSPARPRAGHTTPRNPLPLYIMCAHTHTCTQRTRSMRLPAPAASSSMRGRAAGASSPPAAIAACGRYAPPPSPLWAFPYDDGEPARPLICGIDVSSAFCCFWAACCCHCCGLEAALFCCCCCCFSATGLLLLQATGALGLLRQLPIWMYLVLNNSLKDICL